jgi:Phage integrase protein
MLSAIRHRLIRHAQDRHRDDLVEVFSHPADERQKREGVVRRAIEVLQQLPLPAPLLTHGVELWFSSRAANALKKFGIETLADLTLRVPRRRRWWAVIPGLGVGSAQRIESLFAEHPELTQMARALVAIPAAQTSPWETLVVPENVNGSRGAFRAPQATCTLSATDDYQAVQAWLELQDAQATQRAYRKEAERLMLWAILQRGKALSSLTTEDAIAYRAFLRNPTPRDRWVGPSRPRTSGEWRPFQGALAPRSVGYALSVVGALYRWLIAQRYVLANPFAGDQGQGGEPQFGDQRVPCFQRTRVGVDPPRCRWPRIDRRLDGGGGAAPAVCAGFLVRHWPASERDGSGSLRPHRRRCPPRSLAKRAWQRQQAGESRAASARARRS